MARKLRVYVAGAYSAPNVLAVMGNMRRGIQLSSACAKAGFAVYSPWCDCLLHFHEEFRLEDCYSYSMPWLEASDAVLVVPENCEESNGTQAEIRRAIELAIPVFWSLDELIEWGEENAIY
jgi:nucleoside 2-deoxyribosyltransferase